MICACFCCRPFQGILLMRVNCGAFELWLTTLLQHLNCGTNTLIRWLTQCTNKRFCHWNPPDSVVFCHGKCERGREKRMERSVVVSFAFSRSVDRLVGRSIDWSFDLNCLFLSSQLKFQVEQWAISFNYSTRLMVWNDQRA